MERLTETARQAIGKMNTTRLIIKLTSLGYDEETLADLERKDLIQLYSQALADGKEAAKATSSPTALPKLGYDIEVEKLRISTEMQRHAELMALEKQKLIIEQQRLDAQAQAHALEQQRLTDEATAREAQIAFDRQRLTDEATAREAQIALDRQRLAAEAAARDAQIALERERLQLKHDALNSQRTRDEARDTQDRERRNTMAARTKLFAQSLQNVMPKMSNDAVQLVTFFDMVEKLFENFQVPSDLQAVLLNPHLTVTARSMLSRMDQTKINDFKEVKTFLLTQFKLTPQTYRTRFNNTVKQQDETHVLYANKLHLLLQHYIRARHIEDDFEQLVSCLVSDRLRSSVLDNNCLRYICSLETSSDNGWLDYIDLASAIDSYYANYNERGVPLNATAMTGQVHIASRPGTGNQFRSGNSLPRSTPTTDQRVSDSTPTGSSMTSYRQTTQDVGPQPFSTGQRRSADGTTDVRLRHCWTCGATNHKASECSQRYDRPPAAGSQVRKTIPTSHQPVETPRKPVRVYKASMKARNNPVIGDTVSLPAQNLAEVSNDDFNLHCQYTRHIS